MAHTEHRALDALAPTFDANARETEKLPKLLAALGRMDAPEVAPFMFEFATKFRGLWKKDAPMNVVANAVAWLESHPRNAAIGLVPFVRLSRKSADDLLAQLRTLARAGHAAEVEDALSYFANPSERIKSEVLDAGKTLAPEFDDASTPKWLKDVLSATAPVAAKEVAAAKARKARLPEWLNVDELPPILIDDGGQHRLSREQILEVVVAMQSATATDTAPLILVLRQHGDAENLEGFALKMFESWVRHKAPNPDRWMVHALGQLGSDRAALRLPPLIREWRAGGNQPHAVAGLEALRAIGTDTALTQLSLIACDQRLKALREKAIASMEAIAAALGLSRDRLEDRLIPSGELDKKELKATLGAQTIRLEQALVSQRRWFTDEFERFLVRHSVVGDLIRRLAWTGFDASGAVTAIFRVSVDGAYVDLNHEPVRVDSFAEVGLVHPLRVRADELAAWRELFANLEIEQPFLQLERDVHALTVEEKTQKNFLSVKDFILPAVSIPSVLDKRGWVRGAVESGVFNEHRKYFGDVDVTAICVYQGVPLYYQDAEDQYIDACFFVKGKVEPEFDRDVSKALKGALTLGVVDAVVVSEVLRDLFELSKKAKSHAYE
jgi:hypothetical protein